MKWRGHNFSNFWKSLKTNQVPTDYCGFTMRERRASQENKKGKRNSKVYFYMFTFFFSSFLTAS